MLNSARTAPIIHSGHIILQVVLGVRLRSGLGSFHAVKTEAIEIASSGPYSTFHDGFVVLAAALAGIRGSLIRETTQSV